MEEQLSSAAANRAISRQALQQLHPSEINNSSEIWTILRELQRTNAVLRRGVNRRVDAETTTIERLDAAGMDLNARTFERSTVKQGSILLLNASLDGLPLFFTTSVLESGRTRLRASLPSVIYRAERRDRARRMPIGDGIPTRVRAEFRPQDFRGGKVADVSPDGLAILFEGPIEAKRGDCLRVEFLDGRRSGECVHAQVQNLSAASEVPGWHRLGMRTSREPFSDPIEASPQRFISGSGVVAEARTRWQMLSSMAASRPLRPRGKAGQALPRPSDVEVVDYKNDRGESIRAIVDSYGDRGLQPPSSYPLRGERRKKRCFRSQLTIVETFRKASRPIIVSQV